MAKSHSSKSADFKLLGLHHFKIITSDIGRSVAFYQDVLGYKVTYEAERSGLPVYDRLMGYPDIHLKLAMLTRGKNQPVLAILQFLNPKSRKLARELHSAGVVALTFEVRGLRAYIQKLRKMGVEILAKPENIVRGGKKVASAAYIADPNGVRIEIYEPSA